MKRYINDIEFPECWEEVSPDEFSYLLQLRQKLIECPSVTLRDVNVRWCSYILCNRGIKRRRDTYYYLLLSKLADTLNWVWVIDASGVVTLNYNSTVNLLPRIGKFVGPADHGADLTFLQFRTALSIVRTYNDVKDDSLLTELANVLYKYKNKRLVADMATLYGVYGWFTYFTQYLFSGIFIIDGRELSFASLFSSSSDDEDSDRSIGLSSILFSVAESGVFGNVTEVDNTLLLQVLLKLYEDKLKADALERSVKK